MSSSVSVCLFSWGKESTQGCGAWIALETKNRKQLNLNNISARKKISNKDGEIDFDHFSICIPCMLNKQTSSRKSPDPTKNHTNPYPGSQVDH